jgi:hypothetical protein
VAVYRDEGGGSLVLLGMTPNPATDPVSVTVTALQNGWNVVATQTIGAESDPSAPVTVGVPTVTVVGPLLPGETSVTVADVHADADEVEVLVNGVSAGVLDVSASSAATVVVTVVPALAAGDLVRARQEIAGVVGPQSLAVEVSVPMCLIVFEDAFEANTAANWNVNIADDASLGDAGATFAWDYSAAGIPPAPNSTDTSFGLKFEANNFDATGSAAAVTASPQGLSFTASNGYRLVLDMWINANGPFPAGGTGSTQSFTAGVGYDNTTVNQHSFSTTPVGPAGTRGGDGAWFTISGEGGTARDVQAFKDAGEQFPESGQFAAATTAPEANNTNSSTFYNALFGSAVPPAAQLALFPSQTGTLAPGSAGEAWHRVDVTAFDTKARWSINGTTIVTIDTTVGASISLDGNVSLGHMDGFNSIADVPAMNFSLADNLLVLVPHTPGTNGDYDNDGDVDNADFRYFADCLTGPGQTPNPSTGVVCSVVCTQVFDFDGDGDVDLNDYADFQFYFSSP